MDRVPSAFVVAPYLRVQQAIYRGSRGWIGKRMAGAPTLLLTTVGRRTGKQRTHALTYYRDGSAWVVVASNGGSDRGPRWLANLVADPIVTVQDGRRKGAATAHVATAEERTRLWPLVNRNNRGLALVLHRGVRGRYDVYQRRTEREIAVVVLEPTG
jgi:F420H(2)-dependent quinone reductase